MSIRKRLEIIKDYEDILYYDRPILYSGLNKYNQRVLALFVKYIENEEINIFMLIDEKDYDMFLRKEIKFNDLAKKTKNIYIVKNYIMYGCGRIKFSYKKVKYKNIPKEYLPVEINFRKRK